MTRGMAMAARETGGKMTGAKGIMPSGLKATGAKDSQEK